MLCIEAEATEGKSVNIDSALGDKTIFDKLVITRSSLK